MQMLVRVEFTVEASDADACNDRIADLTYGMRSDSDVSGYREEIVGVC